MLRAVGAVRAPGAAVVVAVTLGGEAGPGGLTGPMRAPVVFLAVLAEGVGGRLSAGPVLGERPSFREPGGRPPPGAVRVVVPPGVRGGVPPGRRESRRPGGRPPGWCCALVMILCMSIPVR